MPKVSVIMPVYNAGKYLYESIGSVINQTFPYFELILIDDGSTDLSPQICDEYAMKDSRIKVVHKKNGGICSARNVGINMAKGKYITFIDNDDIYYPNLLEENYNIVIENKAEIVKFKNKHIIFTGTEKIEIEDGKNFNYLVIRNNEFYENYTAVRGCNGDMVWNGIYEKAFLEKYQIRFNENFHFGHEDIMFNVDCYIHEPSIVLNPKIYYEWRQRVYGSTSMKHSNKGYYENKLNSLLVLRKTEVNIINKIDMHKIDPYYIEKTQPITYFLNELCFKSCTFSISEKAQYLSRLREELFKISSPPTYKAYLYLLKNDMKQFLYLWLFYHSHFYFLILWRKLKTRNNMWMK